MEIKIPKQFEDKMGEDLSAECKNVSTCAVGFFS